MAETINVKKLNKPLMHSNEYIYPITTDDQVIVGNKRLPAAFAEKVSHSDALSLEEIKASTALNGKVASAMAVKDVNSKTVKSKHVSIQRTVAANTAETFDFTSYLDAGERICGATVKAGNYYIPYFSASGSPITFIQSFTDKSITIKTLGSAWNNYYWEFVIFIV